MPKIVVRPVLRTSKTPVVVEPAAPPRRNPVTAGRESGWDLRGVDTDFLIAELIRRGEYVRTPSGSIRFVGKGGGKGGE